MIPTMIEKRNRRRAPGGFTLIELLLVMMIIAILAAVVVPRIAGSGEKAKIAAAKADISNLKTALSMFEVENGSYPTTEQNLQALITNPGNLPNWTKHLDRTTVPNDPWGHPYVYRCPGNTGNDFDLYSMGPDGQDGTADDVKLDQ
jgi:general secretion pathway protein G